VAGQEFGAGLEAEGATATKGEAAALLAEVAGGADPEAVEAPALSSLAATATGADAGCALTMVAAITCEELAFQRFWRASALQAAQRQLPLQAGQI